MEQSNTSDGQQVSARNAEVQTGKTSTHSVYLSLRETKSLTHLVRIGEACATEDGMKVTIWLDHAIPKNSKSILHLDPK